MIPRRLAAFWQAVLGVGVVEELEDWVQLGVGSGRGRVYLAFEPSSEAAPAGRMWLRPDVEVEDTDVAQARIEALGGRLVEIVHERTGETHSRMADPEGNEFTILVPLPADLAQQVYGAV